MDAQAPEHAEHDTPWTIAAIVCFVALVALFVVPFCLLPVSTSSDVLASFEVYASMWTVGLSAIITCRLFGRPVASLPWRAPAGRYGWAGYLIPCAYATVAYVALWVTGLAPPQFGMFDAHAREALALGPGAGVWAGALIVTVGVIRSCSSALGEEIGWRGFLVPALAERMSFAGVVVVSGVIWAAWHVPFILLTGYTAGAPPLYTICCFTVGVMASGGIAAWLTLRSRSLWPAMLLHATHNAVVQRLFDPLTVETGRAAYFATEFGAGLAVTITLAFALLLWKGGVPRTAYDLRTASAKVRQ